MSFQRITRISQYSIIYDFKSLFNQQKVGILWATFGKDLGTFLEKIFVNDLSATFWFSFTNHLGFASQTLSGVPKYKSKNVKFAIQATLILVPLEKVA